MQSQLNSTPSLRIFAIACVAWLLAASPLHAQDETESESPNLAIKAHPRNNGIYVDFTRAQAIERSGDPSRYIIECETEDGLLEISTLFVTVSDDTTKVLLHPLVLFPDSSYRLTYFSSDEPVDVGVTTSFSIGTSFDSIQTHPLPRGPFTPRRLQPPWSTLEDRKQVRFSDVLDLLPADATSLDHWRKRNGDDAPDWAVRDGMTMIRPGTGDIVSRPTFADMRLQLEWMINDSAAARQQGNSGIKIQERYEVQVLDRPRPGTPVENDGAGSIYAMRPPDRNMHLERGQWHTYDILFRAPRWNDENEKIEDARISVVWNGALVHDNVVVPRATGLSGLPEKPGTFGVLLQDHGANVRYRNILAASPPEPLSFIRSTLMEENEPDSFHALPETYVRDRMLIVAPLGLPPGAELNPTLGTIGNAQGPVPGITPEDAARPITLWLIGPGGITEQTITIADLPRR